MNLLLSIIVLLRSSTQIQRTYVHTIIVYVFLNRTYVQTSNLVHTYFQFSAYVPPCMFLLQ